MKVFGFVAGLCALVTFTDAFPSTVPHSIHERRSRLPRLWRRGERVERDAVVPIRIGLTQCNLDQGYEYLMDVSHPSSQNYGKHWSAEEVNEKFAPSADAVRTVRNWLLASGIADGEIVHSENKGWVALDIPAWKAEDLFRTEYYEHVHAESGKVKLGSDEYHLPIHVRDHVDYVTPGVQFSAATKKIEVKRSIGAGKLQRPGPMKQILPETELASLTTLAASDIPDELKNCGTSITPACLKALYNIPNATRNDDVNSLGLYESGDIYAQKDLDLFFAKHAPYVPEGTHPKLDSIDGGQAPVSPNSEYNTGESDIDMDIAFSLIYPQSVTLYQVDDLIEAFEDGGFNVFLDALDGSYCNYTAEGITGDTAGIDPVYPDPAPGGYKGERQCGSYKPTRVISVSYGVSEYDAPVNYTVRQCNEFMKLGLQGVTFLWASGDYGVASFPGDDSASGCLGENETIYNPSFPTCPYVTDVGATRLYANQTVLDRESALQANLGTGAELFATSGGFANYFSVPAYQKDAVDNYFAKHDPGLPYYIANANATNIGENGGVYNRAGRGFPDVSANGALFRAFNGGTEYGFYGTSLSAPIWGSIITLINEERTAVGKGPVGFLNPALYENTWVFNDIVNGSNPGCGGPGFAAVEGWDPVTGLGTPDYPKLLDMFLSLP